MRKGLLVICLILIFCLTACGIQTPDISKENREYTFEDDTGVSVTLSTKPQKVAVLFSSYAEIWTLAGGTVSVTVGESVERGFVKDGTDLVDSGAGKTIDHELLMECQPDFVIGSADIPAQTKACEIIRKSGIPCALFRVDTFDDYLSMLKICTDITGDKDAFETYGATVKSQISDLKKRVSQLQTEPKNILFIRAGSQYSSTKAKRAPDNFVCIMLDELESHNIADDASVLLDGLSLEEILLKNPDYIFISTMGDEKAANSYIGELFSGKGWSTLTAIKNQNYTFLPKDLFHFKPNARWAEAYNYLAELLYPELKGND